MKEKSTNCGIYLIINLKSNKIIEDCKVYAGSSENLKSRKYSHFNMLKLGKHHCTHLQKAYDKIKKEQGKENVEKYFEFRLLLNVEKIEDKPKLKEILLGYENLELAKYKNKDGNINHDKCYNSNPIAGSTLGYKHTKESKNKMSKSSIGHAVTDETREKISKAHKGRIITEEWKNKIGNSNKDRIRTEKSILKWKESMKGYKPTKETKKKMGEARRDKKLSEDTLKKISLANSIKVVNLTTRLTFNSIKEAAIFYNIPSSNISRVCRGIRKTAGKYTWGYIDNVE